MKQTNICLVKIPLGSPGCNGARGQEPMAQAKGASLPQEPTGVGTFADCKLLDIIKFGFVAELADFWKFEVIKKRIRKGD